MIQERRNEKFEFDTSKHESKYIPCCPKCSTSMRPNVLMFNDSEWISDRTDHQMDNLEQWINLNLNKSIVIVEVGAGTSVPTVRYMSESILKNHHKLPCHLIRINPIE